MEPDRIRAVLQMKTAKEVLDWIHVNPNDTTPEIGKYFSKLARDEYIAKHPDPDLLIDPNRKR